MRLLHPSRCTGVHENCLPARFGLGYLNALERYLSHLGNLDRSEFALFDDIEVLQHVYPLVRRLLRMEAEAAYQTRCRAVFQAFDGIVAAVSLVSRQQQMVCLFHSCLFKPHVYTFS